MTTTATDAAIRRAAQALVDACYEERVKELKNAPLKNAPWIKTGEGYVPMPMTIRRCRLCNLENSTHSVLYECPVAELERLLRGAP